MAKNYYEILGVGRDASQDDIKRAFRREAHKHHPDKTGGDAEKFKEANEAYQVLSNKEKRAQYDQYGQTFEQARAQGGGFGGQAGQGFSGWPYGGASAGTFTSEDLGDLFGDLFGFGRRGRARPNRAGADIELTVRLNFNEAAFGVKREIKLQRLRDCEVCKGSGDRTGKLKKCITCDGHGRVREIRQTILGSIAQERICGACHGDGSIPAQPCLTCSGQGRVRARESLMIDVPAGINDGQIIRLTAQGDVGRRGGQPGDVLLTIVVEPSNTFVRDGADVKTRIEVEYPQLVLGDSVDIQGLKNKLEIDIPAGTQPGTIVRLRGEGIPVLNSSRRGDLYVEVAVHTPKNVTSEEKQLLQKLSELRGRSASRRKRRGLFRS
jgi:molecular chaperone DnaJ